MGRGSTSPLESLAPDVTWPASEARGVYVVEVKPSARRASARAGRWVNEHGPERAFESKELARRWARECSVPGRRVWVQDAPGDDADGYLVAGPRRGRERRGEQARLG